MVSIWVILVIVQGGKVWWLILFCKQWKQVIELKLVSKFKYIFGKEQKS